MRVYKILTTGLLALGCIACGQTGPLYLPDSEPPIHVPEEVEEDYQEDGGNQEEEYE